MYYGLTGIAESQSLQEDMQRAQKLSLPETESDAEVDKLVNEVAELQRKGDLQAAIDRCDRAAAMAFKADAVGRAFELSLVGAELARQKGSHSDAADRYERAALGNSNDPRAVDAHYQVIVLLHQLFDRGKDYEQHAERLDKVLGEHTQKWPRSKYASDTVWRRIELLAKRKQWQQLIKIVKQIPNSDSRYVRAQQLLIDAHQKQFAEAITLDATATERNQLLAQMSADLEPMILGKQRTWPARWNKQKYLTATVLSSGHLTRGDAGAKYATTMLSVALRGTPPLNDQLRREMVVLSAIGWLVQNDEDRAILDLASIIPDQQQVLSLIQTTKRFLAERNEAQYPAEAERLLDTIGALLGERQISEQQEIDALRASGRLTEAIEKQRPLAAKYPNSVEHQLALVQMMTKNVADRKQLDNALLLWQQIETRSSAGDPIWHEARLARIELLIRLERFEDAKKLLRLSRLIAPVSEGSDLIGKYNQLGEQLSTLAPQ